MPVLRLPIFLLAAAMAYATPLRLDYSKTWSVNGVDYHTFTMAVDTGSENAAPLSEPNFEWVIFGDTPSLGNSGFNDYAMPSPATLAIVTLANTATRQGAPNPAQNLWLLSTPTEPAGAFASAGTGDVQSFDIGAGGALVFDIVDESQVQFVSAYNPYPVPDYPPGQTGPSSSGVVPPSPGYTPFQIAGPPDPPQAPSFVVTPLATPEPATLGLAGLTLAALVIRRRF